MPGGTKIDSERLKARIALAGLTHAELARRVGVKQPTITRLITGEQGGSKYLHLIAHELKTTPSYLTRETDDPNSDGPDETFTSEEREWVELLRGVRPQDRDVTLQILRTLASRHHRPDAEPSNP